LKKGDILAKFGISYMGSKSGIAADLIKQMPTGKRFVDLFGGGFAMSHCAFLSGRFQEVYYNDINPLLVPLIQDAIDGKYSYDVFKPDFITREEFFEKKDTCGYVKYIWSFGNNGRSYAFGKDREIFQKDAHDYIVHEKWSHSLEPFIGNNTLCSKGIENRTKEFYSLMRKQKTKRRELQRLQILSRISRLNSLGELMRKKQPSDNSTKLTLSTGSYLDYEYQEGDVIYCDIPYEGTAKYSEGGFNHKEFYEWALTCDFPIHISSYELPKDFFCIYEKQKRVMSGIAKTANNKTERLYVNIGDQG